MNKQIIYKAVVLLGFPRNQGFPSQNEIADEIVAQMGWKPIPSDATRKERQRKSRGLLYRYCCAKGLIPSKGMGGKTGNPAAYVYIAQQDGGDRCIKIGATGNPERRLKSLQTGSPYKLSVVTLINADSMEHAQWMESSIHKRLREYRLEGEWFHRDAMSVMGRMVG